MLRFVPVLFFGLLSIAPAFGQTTHVAADCSQATIIALHDSGVVATDGDTIQVPACRETPGSWTGGAVITKGVKILCSTDSVFLDDASGNNLIHFSMTAGRTYRMDNCEFQPGTNTQNRSAGVIAFSGTNNTVVINNIYMNNVRPRHFFFGNNANIYGGGIFNSRFTSSYQGNNDAFGVCSNGWGGWGADTAGYDGEASFFAATALGTNDAFYLEGNTFEHTTSTATIMDGYRGCRMVARYNTLINATFGNHGTGDGTASPGVSKIEIYNNTLNSSTLGHQRGLWQIYANNTITGAATYPHPTYYRSSTRTCSQFGNPGRETWDKMDLTDDGSGEGDDATAGNGIFYQGTASAGSGDLTLVVSPSPGWTTDEWRGYIVHVPTNAINSEGHFSTVIQNNTADTITVGPDNAGACTHEFVSGETFEILRSLLLIDQIGGGRRDKLTHISGGNVDTNGQTGNQEYSPLYMFGNVDSMGDPVTMPTDPIADSSALIQSLVIREDEHFFTDNIGAMYDGSTGIGSGTCSPDERPASPALLRTGFWCTDANTLYQWDGDSWEVYWQPFTYPHPLIGTGPQISTVTPDSGTRTDATVAVTIMGTGFAAGYMGGDAQVNVSGTDVTVSSVVIVSDVEITASINIESDAATGARTITVVTDDGTSGGVSFTITAPALTSIGPTGGNQNTTVAVTITGTTLGGASPTLTISGANVTYNTLVCAATSCTANFVIAAGAATGIRTVTFDSFDGTSNTVDFEVLASGSPTLDTMTPSRGYQDTVVQVRLTGSGLTGGSILLSSLIAWGTASNVVVVSDTVITFDLTITNVYDNDGVLLTSRNVQVTTGGGNSNKKFFTLLEPQGGGPRGKLLLR